MSYTLADCIGMLDQRTAHEVLCGNRPRRIVAELYQLQFSSNSIPTRRDEFDCGVEVWFVRRGASCDSAFYYEAERHPPLDNGHKYGVLRKGTIWGSKNRELVVCVGGKIYLPKNESDPLDGFPEDAELQYMPPRHDDLVLVGEDGEIHFRCDIHSWGRIGYDKPPLWAK